MNNKQSLKVTILCTAFNHEPYIRQCLEGFVMQKTKFQFEAIVHDDASTDGTATIIREFAKKYPDIIKPIYETVNQFSKHDGSLELIMYEHTHGKYVAFCEGDDYWTDPLKLQKQVDIFESNPEVTMIHTAFKIVDDKSNIIKIKNYENYMKRSRSGWIFDELLYGNYILTLTTMFPKEVIKPIPNIDYKLFLRAARMGKTIYLDECTSNYRINPTSITHTDKKYVCEHTNQALYSEIKEFLQFRNNTTNRFLRNNAWIKICVARTLLSRFRHKDEHIYRYICLLLTTPWYWGWILIAIIYVLFKKCILVHNYK